MDPDGDNITYTWTASPGITLDDPTSAMPEFTAPEVIDDTDYTFTLVISDGEYTDTDEVIITVQQDEPGAIDVIHLTPSNVQLTWDAPGMNDNNTVTRDERSVLLGFYVFLDGVQHDEDLLDIDETSYIFINMTNDHSYGVAAVYDDGISDIVSVTLVAEDISELPVVTALTGNYPNPFNPETSIKMALKTDGLVRMDIYNVRGQKIRTLVNEYMEAGNHDIIWTGDDDNGQKVGSGVYFYNMKFGKYTSTKKMILMK